MTNHVGKRSMGAKLRPSIPSSLSDEPAGGERLPRPGEGHTDARLAIFPELEQVMRAFTRLFGSGGIEGGPTHVHGCQLLTQGLDMLQFGSGCHKPLRLIA